MKLSALNLCKAALMLAASVFLITARAEVIENDVIIIDSPNPQYGNQWLTMPWSVQSDGLGLFVFPLSSYAYGVYDIGVLGIAEAYGLYNVAAGDVVDASFVASHAPIVSNYASNNLGGPLTFKNGETKMFAFWDAGFGPRPETYGWVNLTWTEYGLKVASSARALDSGIIAGTTMAVPEPQTTALFLVGLGGIAWSVRRRRRQSVLSAA